MEEHDFGWALRRLKEGVRVCRGGWNGKGMWLIYVRSWIVGNDVAVAAGVGTKMLHFIAMKTAQGDLIPWLASQADMLADDWELVE